MTVEAATHIGQLDTSLPTAADLISEGDDQIRLIKSTLRYTFPLITGPVTASSASLSKVGTNPLATDYSTWPATTSWVKDRIAAASISPGVATPDFLILDQGVL
jgi:hypothetical protein